MLLGAAKILKDHEEEIEGTVKLMFQPGEETLEGAKAMIDAGVLENPSVDAAMMIHVAAGMPVPSGLIVIPEPGPVAAASDWFDITIKGKGGHGAMPDMTIDPLNVMGHIHTALQSINSREISPVDCVVVSVGMMQGGTTHNVIPDTARMCGTIRTFTSVNRSYVPERIKAIAESTAKAFRAEAQVTIKQGCPSVLVDEVLQTQVSTILTEAFGEQSVMPMPEKMMGSEDFSFVTHEVPSIMLSLTTGSPEEGYLYPMHHPKVMFDEAQLHKGAAVYAETALSWLKVTAQERSLV